LTVAQAQSLQVGSYHFLHSDDRLDLIAGSDEASRFFWMVSHFAMRLLNIKLSVKKSHRNNYFAEYLSNLFFNGEAVYPTFKKLMSVIDNTRYEGPVKD